jgi:hypothetical protein
MPGRGGKTIAGGSLRSSPGEDIESIGALKRAKGTYSWIKQNKNAMDSAERS